MGLTMDEIFDLGALAADRAADKVCEFFSGRIGSPIYPHAIEKRSPVKQGRGRVSEAILVTAGRRGLAAARLLLSDAASLIAASVLPVGARS